MPLYDANCPRHLKWFHTEAAVRPPQTQVTTEQQKTLIERRISVGGQTDTIENGKNVVNGVLPRRMRPELKHNAKERNASGK